MFFNSQGNVRAGALAFFFGIVVFHGLAQAPPRWWGWGLALTIPLIVASSAARLLGSALAGFLWAVLMCGSPTPLTTLPPELEATDLQVRGWVASIPETMHRGTRFQLQIDALWPEGSSRTPITGRLRLTWYAEQAPLVRVGDRWRFSVRLKRPHGLANPGGFDYERWFYAAGVIAQGYVRNLPPPERLGIAERYPLGRLRQDIAEDFHRLLPHSPFVGMLTALAIGDRHGIGDDQWDMLRRTGTGHLMAISGLHIGLVAGLGFLLMRGVWRLLPLLPRRWVVNRLAAAVGLVFAFGYAVLAGGSLPTQRALIMISLIMLALIWRRPIVASRVLALALVMVLIMDPAAPLSGGFWLSFGAVATILYLLCGRAGGPLSLGQWLKLQLGITAGLVPASLVLFQSTSLVSPLANMIAIPWMSVTVVPMTLLAVVMGVVSELAQLQLLELASLAMDWLWQFLDWMARPSWNLVQRAAPPFWILGLVLPGLLLLLAPRGIPGRLVGLVLCLLFLYFPRALPPEGAVWLTVLDVGQGLATVIRTADHVLVYDTGPRFGPRFDAGKAVLAPFLRQQGIERIDTLIVSHADGHHSGGVRSLLEHFEVRRIMTSSPREMPIQGAIPCRRGMAWVWGEVSFSLLHPPSGTALRRDEASCVLLVENRHGERILLAGDIGFAGESALISAFQALPRADVLVAPRQGARPPPSTTLLDRLQPRYVLFSTGYRNRYGYPTAQTVQGYSKGGAIVLSTAEHGAISFMLEGSGGPVKPLLYRTTARRHWNAR